MNFNNDSKEPSRPRVPKKQAIAIAVVLALGVMAGVGIMSSGGKSSGEASHAHEEAEGHGDGEHHDDAKAASAKGGHADAKAHGDGEHHKEAGKEAGKEEQEGVIALTPEQQAAAGIMVEAAKPATPAPVRLQAPGESTEAVLREELGLSDDDIATLLRDGIVGRPAQAQTKPA